VFNTTKDDFRNIIEVERCVVWHFPFHRPEIENNSDLYSA